MKQYFSTTLIFLFLAVCTIGCKHSTEHIFSPQETITLTNPTVIPLANYDLMNPLSLKIRNNTIVVLDDNTENQINIISLTDSSIYKIGNSGRGPGEFLQITSTDPYEKNDSLCVGVYDTDKKEYMNINTKDRTNPITLLWTNDTNMDAVSRMNDNIYVCAPVFDSTSLCLLNNAGKIIDRYTLFPPKPNNVPLLSHSMACTGILAVSPKDNKFARAVFYDGGIRFFAIKKNKIVQEWEFSTFDMEYGIDKNYNNIPMPNEETRRGYTSLTFSNDYLYGLFDGKNFLEHPDGQTKYIHVFDFNGKHIKEYILSNDVFDIGVDLENKHIYCLSLNANQEIDLLIYDI